MCTAYNAFYTFLDASWGSFEFFTLTASKTTDKSSLLKLISMMFKLILCFDSTARKSRAIIRKTDLALQPIA